MKPRRPNSIQEVFEDYGIEADVLDEYRVNPLDVIPVRGALCIETSSGRRMLKRARVTRSQLDFVRGWIEHLHSRGVSTVPRFINTVYGDAYVVDQHRLYYMTEWFPGRSAQLHHQEQFLKAIEALAKIHRFGSGYQAASTEIDLAFPEDFRVVWRQSVQKWRSLFDQAARTERPTEVDLLLRDEFAEAHQHMEMALSHLEDTTYSTAIIKVRESRLVCHGSYCRQNLIFKDGRIHAVDFDHAHCGLPVVELGDFLHRYLSRYGWNGALGRQAIDTYASILPLSTEDVEILAVYLMWPKRLMQLFEWYYEQRRSWDVERYEVEIARVLEQDEDRMPFIQDLLESIGTTDRIATSMDDLDGEGSSPGAFSGAENGGLVTAVTNEPTAVDAELMSQQVLESPQVEPLPSETDHSRQPLNSSARSNRRRRETGEKARTMNGPQNRVKETKRKPKQPSGVWLDAVIGPRFAGDASTDRTLHRGTADEHGDEYNEQEQEHEQVKHVREEERAQEQEKNRDEK